MRTISVCVLLTLCLSFGACSKSVEKQIVGKWSRLDETWPAQRGPRKLGPIYTLEIEFLSDGIYTTRNEWGDSGVFRSLEGKYKLTQSGGVYQLVLDKAGVDLLNVRASGPMPLNLLGPLPRVETLEAKYAVKIEGNKLTLSSENGEPAFLRVEP